MQLKVTPQSCTAQIIDIFLNPEQKLGLFLAKNVLLNVKLNLRREQEVRQFMTSRHIFKVRESRGGRPQTIHIYEFVLFTRPNSVIQFHQIPCHNKLASLKAMLVWNSAHAHHHPLSDRVISTVECRVAREDKIHLYNCAILQKLSDLWEINQYLKT